MATDAQAGTRSSPGAAMAAPSLTLPKGGGAIRGIGEKFTASSATGTGTLSVPIATSPGRGGFGPALEVAYDSGAGNGSFGLGWSLHLPAVTRRTDKGLPQYRDAEDSDVFLLSGAEDLVPAYRLDADGHPALGVAGQPRLDEQVLLGHLVRRYRPRTEGLFARIERWIRLSDGDTHWRTVSKDNVLTVYGATPESRIADPAQPTHIYSWLICQSYDDRGNAVSYGYAAENGVNVDPTRVSEARRSHTAHRYLKTVRYGNRRPLLTDPALPHFRQPHLPAPDLSTADWMFEVLLDYGEGHYQEDAPDGDGRVFATAALTAPANGAWPARPDAFSTCRPGFEVRTHRLCRQVLMFHHFPGELGVDDCLVRATEFTYLEKPNGSLLTQVVQSGFRRLPTPEKRYLKRSLPPLEFGYSASPLDDLTHDQLLLRDVGGLGLHNLPAGLDGRAYRWVDLDGESISGVLSEQGGGWYYKPNLGEGQFGPLQTVAPLPSMTALGQGRQQLLDLAGDGRLDLVDFSAPTPGFSVRSDEGDWRPFQTFAALPAIDW